ncbi:MAG: NAD(P)-dependent oxidoreductase, partial [Candidatus Kaiserbacteria bacterium]|nr:NAD(P)-dependent oxidoreductase [Candidatus Kaiserbacteria bacterium]
MIKKESRVLITGCGGMLGEAVYNVFSDKCTVLATDIDLNEEWLSKLDVREREEIVRTIDDFKPDYIIHLAALTDLEYCELNPVDAYKTNAEGTLFLANEALKNNIPFLYVSTAGIFDGKQDTYTEEDVPNPLNVYGRAKYFGELAVRNIPKSIVIRAGWMMGGGPKKDKKFINKVIKQLAAGNHEVFALSDIYGAPCYTHDLAKSIYYLLDTDAYGLYHGTCAGSASRYDVAQYLLQLLGVHKKITLHDVK